MAYTAGFSVSVGDPTKASDVSVLAANDDYLKAAVDAAAVLSGTTPDTVATVTGANALVGEADLTFASNKLTAFGPDGSSGTGSAGILNLSTRETGVVDADQLGRIEFQAPAETQTGDARLVAASIYAEADVAFDATNNATDIVFATAHDGAAAERFRITSQGEIGLAGANYGTDGYVLTSAGAGAAVAWEAIPAGITFSGSTANGVVTYGNSSTANVESNLVFNDSTNILAVGNNVQIRAGDTAAGDDAAIGWETADGLLLTGQGSTNDVTIKNDADGTVLEIATGTTNVEITSGNLVIGTSGKGIDFSATSDAGGMTSELLDDYEEGTWVVAATAASGTITLRDDSSGPTCSYTKIGRQVYAQGYFEVLSVSSPSGSLAFSLPFTVADLTESSGRGSGSIAIAGLGSSKNAMVIQTYEGSALFYVAEFTDTDLSGPANAVQLNTVVWFQVTYIA